MPKSKHRKNHKKKVQEFKRKKQERTNVMNKIFQEQLVKIMEERQKNSENGGEQNIGE
jgi:hypothetical protein